ncbi:cobalamin biosynthesis protein CbiG, partial [Psychromonas aquatilis]
SDPAVLVFDEQGQFVNPLLSGHEGGANELARQVTQLLQNQLVLNTANSYLKPKYVVGMCCERHCPEAVL